jgi:hypothetical protein
VAHFAYVAQGPFRDLATQWVQRCDAVRNIEDASGLICHRLERYSKLPKAPEIR